MSELERPDLPFELPEGHQVVKDLRDEHTRDGVVVVKDRKGRLKIIWIKDKNRHTPVGPGMGVDVKPEKAHEAGPFGGALKDLEVLEVPYHRLPSSLSDPWPEPGPDGRMSDEDKREFKRRVDQDDKESKRVIFVTQEGSPPDQYILIRVFDGMGNLVSTRRKSGVFKQAIINKDTGEKIFLVKHQGILHWIVIDIADGRIVTDSTFGLQIDLPVVSIESVGGNIVVIQKWRGGGWIRIQIYGTDGQLRHVIDIPGSYVASTTNDRDVKAIAMQRGDRVYQDLVRVDTGTRTATGHAENPITGTHAHLQYDKVNGEERYVEVVYNGRRKETEVRILDREGRNVATRVFPGRFRHLVKHRSKKIFIVERPIECDAVVLDLKTGRQGPIKSAPGTFRRIEVSSGGVAKLTASGGSTVPFSVN